MLSTRLTLLFAACFLFACGGEDETPSASCEEACTTIAKCPEEDRSNCLANCAANEANCPKEMAAMNACMVKAKIVCDEGFAKGGDCKAEKDAVFATCGGFPY